MHSQTFDKKKALTFYSQSLILPWQCLGLFSFIILPYKTSAYSVAVFLFKFRLDFYFIIFKNSCFVKSFAKP